MQIYLFEDRHISAASHILATRHRRDRRGLPILPPRFEEVANAKAAIESAWARPWSSGAVAMLDGEMVGYLFGSARIDSHTGRAVWVRPAGYGLSDGVDAEVMRDLYAVAGAKWVELGCFDHVAMISAADRPLLEAWYSLCFGQQHAYGLCTFNNLPGAEVNLADDITIRRANPVDADHMERLCYITGEHQFHAPTWAPTPVEIMAGRPENYRGIVDDEEAVAWLAVQSTERGEEALGFQVYYEAEPEPDDLYVPESCFELAAAGTLAETRGQGIGLALTQAGFGYAKEARYTYGLTDWRTTNLQSSRFWPSRGYQPVVYRLFRRVDKRIAWANQVN